MWVEIRNQNPEDVIQAVVQALLLMSDFEQRLSF